MSDCPTEATLERLEAGVLGELTFAGVEEHVESCAKCQSLLQVLVREDRRAPGRTALPGGHDVPAVPGFVIERELGRGSNGVVFLARDGALERHVALKMMRAVDRQQPDGRSPKLTEEQAVSRLRHPHIVHLYHRLEVGRWTVLVLEYVPGGSLKERLSAPLESQLAAELLETVARAIGHVHKVGLLHLDIKPSNILVDGEPGARLEAALLKVSDFGIALPFAGQPCSGEAFAGPRGTPSYMAPEQAGALTASIGPAADIYGLGALLYHLLTGRPPFESPSARQTLELIGTAEPVPPRQLNPRIPRDLELICLHCLAKRPERRYDSAETLAGDLRRFLDGRRISVRPAASMEQVGRWCRRRPAIAALVVALVMTVLASLSVLLFLLRRSEFNRREADAARRQAEENETLASRTLEELDVWAQRILADPDLLKGKQLPILVDDVRVLTEQLHTDQESVLRMTATVSLLERHLARNLQFAVDRSRLPEARDLLARSRRHLADCLFRKPDAPVLREQYMLTLLDYAEAARSLGQHGESESCNSEVAALVPTIDSRDLRVRALCHMSRVRWQTAFEFRADANPREAEQVMRTNLQMLEGLSPEDAEAADLRLQSALTLSWLGRDDEAVRILRELTQCAPSDWVSFDEADRQIRYWIAHQVAERILWTRSPAQQPVDLEDEGNRLVELMWNRAAAVGIAQPALVTFTDRISTLMQHGCAAERRQNKVERKFGSAARFLALARRLAAAFPDHVDTHLLVARAHHQLAKNAWYFDDEGAALEEMQEAIAAARRAVDVDPRSPGAAFLVADLERRVAKSQRAE